MKKTVVGLLRRISRSVVKKYSPTIVGITGSVGKTSTKEAAFTVLRAHTTVRRNLKSYNNEFGAPLTILGSDSGYRSPWRWLGVIVRGLGLLLRRSSNYPSVLVLEMGADRPGDIAALTSLAPCDIAVVTAIAEVHTEYFGSINHVTEEKATIIHTLKPSGTAVLNADDQRVSSLAAQANGRRVITYGFAKSADIRADHCTFLIDPGTQKSTGMVFDLIAKDEMVLVTLPGVLANHQVADALAAACVGRVLGMTLPAIAKALGSFEGPPGRMRLIPGIKQTMIIDDSYNASPRSTLAALETLKSVPRYRRRIACLGDMAELGQYSDQGHVDVGQRAAALHVDLLLTVGAQGRQIADAARRAGLPASSVFCFDQSTDAGRFLQDRMGQNDLILIKGSQVVRMERIVKEVMAEPERAPDLLVRQEPSWLAKP